LERRHRQRRFKTGEPALWVAGRTTATALIEAEIRLIESNVSGPRPWRMIYDNQNSLTRPS